MPHGCEAAFFHTDSIKRALGTSWQIPGARGRARRGARAGFRGSSPAVLDDPATAVEAAADGQPRVRPDLPVDDEPPPRNGRLTPPVVTDEPTQRPRQTVPRRDGDVLNLVAALVRGGDTDVGAAGGLHFGTRRRRGRQQQSHGSCERGRDRGNPPSRPSRVLVCCRRWGLAPPRPSKVSNCPPSSVTSEAKAARASGGSGAVRPRGRSGTNSSVRGAVTGPVTAPTMASAVTRTMYRPRALAPGRYGCAPVCVSGTRSGRRGRCRRSASGGGCGRCRPTPGRSSTRRCRCPRRRRR